MKRNSWHAKLYLFFCDADKQTLPDNFCIYVWGLVWRIFAMLCLGGMVTFIFLGLPLLWWFQIPDIHGEPLPWQGGFAGYLVLLLVIVLGLCVLYCEAEEWPFVRALRDYMGERCCPRITWADDE